MILRLSLQLLVLIILVTPYEVEANPYIDSLKNVAKTATHDTVRYEAFFKLGQEHREIDYQISLYYWNEALKIAERRRDRDKTAFIYHLIGSMLFRQGELVEALDYMTNSLALFEHINDSQGIGRVYNDMGLIYRTWGRYDQSLEMYLKAQSIFESISDARGWSIASNNIGQIYFYSEDYHKAIRYFIHYLDYNVQNNFPSEVAGASNNIAAAYMQLEDFDGAYEYFTKSKQIYDSLGIMIGVAILDDNIGSLMVKKSELDKAFNYHYNALKIFKQLNSQLRLAHTNKNLGFAYYKAKKYDKAKFYLTAGKEIASQRNIPELLKDIYLILSEVYDSTKQYQQALFCHKQFINLRDSLQSAEVTQKISELEQKHEDERKTREFKVIQRRLKQQQKFAIVLLAVGVVFIFITLFYLWLNFRKNKAINRYSALCSLVSESIKNTFQNNQYYNSLFKENFSSHYLYNFGKPHSSAYNLINTRKGKFVVSTIPVSQNMAADVSSIALGYILQSYVDSNVNASLKLTAEFAKHEIIKLNTANSPICSDFGFSMLCISGNMLEAFCDNSTRLWVASDGLVAEWDSNDMNILPVKSGDYIYIATTVTSMSFVDSETVFATLEKTIKSICNSKLDSQAEVFNSTLEQINDASNDIKMHLMAFEVTI